MGRMRIRISKLGVGGNVRPCVFWTCCGSSLVAGRGPSSFIPPATFSCLSSNLPENLSHSSNCSFQLCATIFPCLSLSFCCHGSRLGVSRPGMSCFQALETGEETGGLRLVRLELLLLQPHLSSPNALSLQFSLPSVSIKKQTERRR